MKPLVTFTLLATMAALISGCAGIEDYEARLRPPDALNPVFMRYKELAGQKVFVVAVDPTGNWAFGYDHGRDTLKEAAHNAAVKCDKAREKYEVFNKAKRFAINDEVVYYDNQ